VKNIKSKNGDITVKREILLILIGGGITLLVFGIIALDSLSSEISRLFTGSPTDKAIWMFVGGITAIVIGLFGLLMKSDKT
jgi:uncharacterized membrane protein YidH (DUF202 family)